MNVVYISSGFLMAEAFEYDQISTLAELDCTRTATIWPSSSQRNDLPLFTAFCTSRPGSTKLHVSNNLKLHNLKPIFGTFVRNSIDSDPVYSIECLIICEVVIVVTGSRLFQKVCTEK